MDGGAWQSAVHGVAKSRTRLSDFTFTFHFHPLEKKMATHSSVLAWRIPGMAEPGGLCRLWGRTESDTTEATQQQQCSYYQALKLLHSSLVTEPFSIIRIKFTSLEAKLPRVKSPFQFCLVVIQNQYTAKTAHKPQSQNKHFKDYEAFTLMSSNTVRIIFKVLSK